jgi:hypothetical protein
VSGLTWVFAFLAFGTAATAMQVLFCVFNSLQGFFIFMFLNIREKPVRKAWKGFFTRCGRRAATARLTVRGPRGGEGRQGRHEVVPFKSDGTGTETNTGKSTGMSDESRPTDQTTLTEGVERGGKESTENCGRVSIATADVHG